MSYLPDRYLIGSRRGECLMNADTFEEEDASVIKVALTTFLPTTPVREARWRGWSNPMELWWEPEKKKNRRYSGM